MDSIGLITLRAEIGDDLRVASEAVRLARPEGLTRREGRPSHGDAETRRKGRRKTIF